MGAGAESPPYGETVQLVQHEFKGTTSNHCGQANQLFNKSDRASRHSLFSGSVYTRHYGTHWT